MAVYSATDETKENNRMPYKRKTRDCWKFYVNYGSGWEHETTELTRSEMKENRKSYRDNCRYPLRIKFGRERIAE